MNKTGSVKFGILWNSLQRGTGREKYLSPPKLVGKDKKGSDK